MLRVGSVRCFDGRRWSRRGLLHVGSRSAVGACWPKLAQAAREGEGSAAADAIILLWLWGGPSHLDTFDPKPQAPLEYRGPYAPIATSVAGTHIGELLPLPE